MGFLVFLMCTLDRFWKKHTNEHHLINNCPPYMDKMGDLSTSGDRHHQNVVIGYKFFDKRTMLYTLITIAASSETAGLEVHPAVFYFIQRILTEYRGICLTTIVLKSRKSPLLR